MAPVSFQGIALIDPAGKLAAADADFKRLLGLPEAGEQEAFARLVAQHPSLGRLMQGEVGEAQLPAADGTVRELARRPCDSGAFLEVRAGPATSSDELALHALALARVAGGFAHDLRNPLNAMALQLALLTDKIAAVGEGLATACGGNLAAMRNQISRIDDAIRRHTELSDPAAAPGFDAGALLAAAAAEFGHESRRRRIRLAADAPAAGVRAAGDAARAARLFLAVLARAFACTADGGEIEARVAAADGAVLVTWAHADAPGDDGQRWSGEVLAAAARSLGGTLEEVAEGGRRRWALSLREEGT